MRLLRHGLELILRFKSGLPLNGDWLVVTENISEGEEIDAAKGYEEPNKVLEMLSGATTAATKIIFERAKGHEAVVEGIANRVYDKAKVIFGTASFSATLLLALGSTLLPPLFAGVFLLKALGVALSFFLALHLSRALIIAAEVMIRESFVRESPGELIGLCKKEEGEALSGLTARVLAYSIQTHGLGLKKLRQLIVAQNSFRWALVYYFVLVVVCVVVRLGGAGVDGPNVGLIAQELKAMKGSVEAAGSDYGQLASRVDRMEREQTLTHQDLKESIELRKAELGFLRALDEKLKQDQAARLPPAAPNRKQP